MYITEVLSKGKGGKRYRSILLRENYRDGSKVKSKTLAVLTKLPRLAIEALRRAIDPSKLSLESLGGAEDRELELRCGESFAAVWVVTELAKRLGIDKALGVTFEAELALWQVIARVLQPAVSLLAMVRLALGNAAAAVLGWRKSFSEDDLYATGSWLEGRQHIIERRLWEARPAKARSELFLYDVTSSYLEGEHNELGAYGYNRDGKRGKQQLVVGLLADEEGEPCAVKVFPGNTSDVKTFGQQVEKVKKEFGCTEVTLVGDRGIIRGPQIADLKAAGLHYISALTKPQIEKLLAEDILQLGLFDEKICEVLSPEGRRYLLRRNPVRQQEIEKNRGEKHQAIEQALNEANQYLATHPRAKVEVQQKKILSRIAKLQVPWLTVTVTTRLLALSSDEALKSELSRLDGCYVIHTDLKPSTASAQVVHDRYKDLATVERDFRTLKTGHLEFRPWFVCKEENTQAHALTSMLALKIRRHMEQAWSTLECTVEEGLSELATLCVTELVHSPTNKVVARILPRPSMRQLALLDALGLSLPQTPPVARVTVGTRKKIQSERKTNKN
jgi:transposase